MPDFGLARAYAEGRQTQAGTVTGTVQYLAPEQIRGEPADLAATCTRSASSATSCSPGSSRSPARPRCRSRTSTCRGGCRCPARPSTRSRPSSTGSWRAPPTATEKMRPESALAMHHDLDAIAPSLPLRGHWVDRRRRARGHAFNGRRHDDRRRRARRRGGDPRARDHHRHDREGGAGYPPSVASAPGHRRPRGRARRLGLGGVDVSDPHRADVPALAGVGGRGARSALRPRLRGRDRRRAVLFASRGGSRDPCSRSPEPRWSRARRSRSCPRSARRR